jgi:hypothetical protein
MKRLSGKLTYANVISTFCLVLLLGGGTAYAASQLGKESVGTKQLAKGAVTPAKLSKASKKTLTGPKGATGAQGIQGIQGKTGEAGKSATALWAEVSGAGAVVKGSGTVSANKLSTGTYQVIFNQNVKACTYQATPAEEEEFGFVIVEPRGGNEAGVFVETTNTTGTDTDRKFDLAVFC